MQVSDYREPFEDWSTWEVVGACVAAILMWSCFIIGISFLILLFGK